MRSATLPLLAVAALLSCSDPAGPRTPAHIDVIRGTQQRAVVGTELPERISVEVRDAEGRVLRGTRVRWSVTGGRGTVSTPSVLTSMTGHATVTWTLGTTAGTHRLQADADGVQVTVTAVAEAGAPAEMNIVSGDDQFGIASLSVPEALRVRVWDEYGNSVRDVTVTFTASGGSVNPVQAQTNSGGVAQTIWTPDASAGAQTVSATTGGLAPVQFNASVQPRDALVALQNDIAVGGLDGAAGARAYYAITVPPNVPTLTFAVTGTAGDVDLFVRQGALPSTLTHGCRSVTATASELCVVHAPAPGEWFVMLHAFTDYSDASLRASYQVGGGLGVTITGLPQGTDAAVTLSGPSHYNRELKSSETLTGLVPGSYTLTAQHVIGDANVYQAEPDVQQINVPSGSSAAATVTYSATEGVNLDITGVYLTQSVQRPDGTVPLVAGRDGLVRVFARSNTLSSGAPAAVRVRVYQGGTLVHTAVVPAPSASVPVVPDEAELTSTWNVQLPGSLIQPGTAMLVDVDPDGVVTETDETDNTYPATGTPLAFDIRAVSPLRVRLVPVLQQPNSFVGDVNESNLESYITKAEAIYPVPEIDADVREPYTFSGVLGPAYDSAWSRLLSEMLALRTSDGSDRYYYGVIKPSYTTGGTGLGFIGAPAAIGVEWPNWRAETVAHEWGHNFGRRHVACGGPSSPDPAYPYAGGAIGRYGWDMRSGELVDRDAYRDVLSYCQPTWASDYTYEAVLSFRAGESAMQAAEPALLVWGRISPDGVVLEPSFEVHAPPALPKRAGDYRITATSAGGATLLDLSFDGIEIDHMPDVRHFAFTVPLRLLGGERPSELRLRGAGIDVVRRADASAAAADVRVTRAGPGTLSVEWNAASTPALLVRDAATGRVLTIARGGAARIATDATELLITASNGVASSIRRVPVTR